MVVLYLYNFFQVGFSVHKLKGSFPQDCLYFRCLGGHQHFWWLAWLQIWGFPWFFFRFDNLLDWSTEFRKMLYLGLPFYYKGYKWTTRYVRQGTEVSVGLAQELPSTWSQSVLLSWYVSMFTNQEALWTLFFRVFEAALHRHNWLNHWPCDWTQSLNSLFFSEVGR